MGNFFQSVGNLFSGIFNFFGTTGNFITFLLNNIWWVIGGALVAFVIILIISLILHSFPNWVITVLVCIFCIGGALGLAAIFNNSQDKPDNNNGTITRPNTSIIIQPSDTIKIVSNGGFNSSYINAKENDPNCPTSEDKTFDINLIEYNDRAIFYYDIKIGQDKYYTANMIFNKTQNGLVPVGSFNVHAQYAGKDGFWAWSPYRYTFINEFDGGNTFSNLDKSVYRYNGATFTNLWHAYLDPKMPTYYDISYTPYDKSILMQEVRWDFNEYMTGEHSSDVLHNTMQEGIYKIYQDNFQQLDKLGIKCASDIGASADMTSFYNALYKATIANGCSSVVDVTNLVADVQYGVIYKSNRFVNINYTYRNTDVYGTDEVPNESQVDKFLDHNKPDNTITTIANPALKIKLINTNNADLTTFSIKNHPVTIKLTGNNNYNYIYVFDDIDKLHKGMTKAVPFGTYNLTITSNVLDFGGTTAKCTTDKSHSTIELRYQFNGDSVNSKITLSPVRSVDLNTFNIEDTPVTITLVNNETQQSYEVKFDTDKKFKNGIVENLKLGNYTYTIVSAGLSFEFATGNFTLTPTQFDCVFYYDYLLDSLTSITLINGGEFDNFRDADAIVIDGLDAILSQYDSNLANWHFELTVVYGSPAPNYFNGSLNNFNVGKIIITNVTPQVLHVTQIQLHLYNNKGVEFLSDFDKPVVYDNNYIHLTATK